MNIGNGFFCDDHSVDTIYDQSLSWHRILAQLLHLLQLQMTRICVCKLTTYISTLTTIRSLNMSLSLQFVVALTIATICKSSILTAYHDHHCHWYYAKGSQTSSICKQEGCAIAKMIAQCAPYMGALKIFWTLWLHPQLFFPKIFMGVCSDWSCEYA